MKQLASVIKFYVILSLILVSGCASEPQILQKNCKILIERPEVNGGMINLIPCTVKINSGQEVTLYSSRTVDSLFVTPGTYFLTATSPNPYPDATKDSDWKSSPIKIRIKDSQVVKIIVEPKSEGSTYVGGWILRQQ